MYFQDLLRDKVYRVVHGNDTFSDGDLVWIDSLNPCPHLNSVQASACLDADEIEKGALKGLMFEPAEGWEVETKHGAGGYSRVFKI